MRAGGTDGVEQEGLSDGEQAEQALEGAVQGLVRWRRAQPQVRRKVQQQIHRRPKLLPSHSGKVEHAL